MSAGATWEKARFPRQWHNAATRGAHQVERGNAHDRLGQARLQPRHLQRLSEAEEADVWCIRRVQALVA